MKRLDISDEESGEKKSVKGLDISDEKRRAEKRVEELECSDEGAERKRMWRDWIFRMRREERQRE